LQLHSPAKAFSGVEKKGSATTMKAEKINKEENNFFIIFFELFNIISL
jgi:hypothetical protein